MNGWMEAAVAWALVGTISLLGGVRARQEAARRQRLLRMRGPALEKAPLRWRPQPGVWLGAAVDAVGRRLLPLCNRTSWERQLAQAHLAWSVERLLGTLALITFATGAAMLALAHFAHLPAREQWLFALVAALSVALLIPAHLRTMAQERRRALQEALPDLLEFVAVSLAAGLSLDGALSYVVPRLKGVVREVFEEYLDDLRVGHSRREALQRLTQRTQTEDLERFAALVYQAEQLGSGLHETLRQESRRLRQARLMAARERAGRLPVQITVPIVLFLLPALYVILLGPAALSVLHSLGGLL
ncbi:MAG: type II secretion system F family protein [Firmicutes bacterium]|nr:type II secretion system F family protein [Bacillota bacterium]